jgi:hypothetical protein
MQILFADPLLQRTVESRVTADAQFGPQDGALIRQRLCELIAADTLAIAATVPTLEIGKFDSHPAKFTARVRAGLHVRFEAADHLGNDALGDLSKVSAIRILAIEET